MRDAVAGVGVLREGLLSRIDAGEELDALQVRRLRLHRLEPSRPLRDAPSAAAFVRDRAIVMESGASGLPVLSEAIVGRHLRGSWMADRDVYRIHRVMNGVRRHGILAAPLVLGKETLFVPALAPAVERVAADEARRSRVLAELPPLARRLLDDAERHGEVWMDRWGAAQAQARQARLLLVRQMLVWSRSIHTERGYHTALVIPWWASEFSRRFTGRAAGLSYDEAARRLLRSAIRSGVVVKERDARRWFVFGSGPLDAMLEEGLVRRLRAGRTSWLSAGVEHRARGRGERAARGRRRAGRGR